jgi:hypothetical protein
VVVVLGMIPVLVELWLILKAAGCLISFFLLAYLGGGA